MTKEQVIAAFPIGSTVKPKDGTPFYGGKRTGIVHSHYGYRVAFLPGIQYVVGVVGADGQTFGDYHPHELEQA